MNSPQDGDEREHIISEPAFDGAMPNVFPWDLILVLVKPVCAICDDGDVENGESVDGGVIGDVRAVSAQENRVAQNRYQDGYEHLDTWAVSRI